MNRTKSCETPFIAVSDACTPVYVAVTCGPQHTPRDMGLLRHFVYLSLEVLGSVVDSGGRCFGHVLMASMANAAQCNVRWSDSVNLLVRTDLQLRCLCVRLRARNCCRVCRRIRHNSPLVLSYALASVMPPCRRVCG